ncbi:tryptophan 7-halogenase [Sphingomonas ginkgonis]|uniref:Tryptophan 7-halogenase n=1 Tax=Sphingomonas ginkgonis TaxID=2315330 RepID=A0A429VBW6_9SPHN|nr:tryptophan halogenase family protein [Sphingomonas ginkgonis]RST31381.1 tryptophan 7-halogenase [Sphingomonas ginkgonis]
MNEESGRPIRNLCIVGGGTAGWIAAALLGHYAGHLFRIRLVESEEIGTIGVGESTIPPFLQLIARLGISESEFIRETQASFKLGIRFDDWLDRGSSYFHPFGAIGAPNPPVDPYQLWLRARTADPSLELQSLAPASVMADAGRFMLPFKAATTPVGGAAYALHVDAKRVAAFLRRFAEGKGVVRTEGLVDRVEAEGDQVAAIVLRSGERIAADLFVDCTGFRSLLLGQALEVPLDDWSDLLLCDRAVVVQTENIGPPPPFTLAEAQDAGWRWRIPLQHRTGNGHVFSSRHMGADEARSILLAKVEGRPVTEPMLLSFTTGARREMWRGNVVAAGLSAGFIEPLESTAIHLVYRAIDFLLRYLPGTSRAPELAAEFNRRMTGDYVEIRDFIIAHYSLTRRRDAPFWRDVASIELPAGLRHRVAMFADAGMLPEVLDGLFSAVSWQSVLDGMGVLPRRPHPSVANAEPAALARDLRGLEQAIGRTVQQLPTHQAFLDQHCRAEKPLAA